MRIYPAIDIKDGKAVRLVQGKFDEVTVFNDNPAEAAKAWAEAGANYIHIVDLDGARYGKSFIIDILKEISSKYNIPVQTGGGVRTIEDIRERIESGAARVIIGTAAVENPQLVREAIKLYGDKIAVGVDAKNGMVAIKGWEEVSDVSAVDLCLEMKKLGVKTIIYTDISKDGMMCGPNIEATKELIEKTGMEIIASGGVSKIDDLENVFKINAQGVIIGKALYNGAINLSDAIDKFEKGEKNAY
ncbi:MAG: 1-(5-phosphoribosyl)-5-[(5-phosphoribosylamino)methylideneamino]imidazole-4-carboxamide isomerase [Clostridiales bacterium]|nr:1-(5-phosphoribosyl)-5-[(5-phosphoribosylamino)methylideneamino]imidazole-4-carboxamide isomerase [Clostridiales bacterium]